MPIADVSPATLQRLRMLAATRGQSLDAWLEQLIDLAEQRPPRVAGRRLGTPGEDPLVEIVHEYLSRLCTTERERQAVGAALRAAATDGELCRVGPFGRDGVILELSPAPDHVRLSAGGGRFVLSDAAVRRVANRLSLACWRPTLAA
jgi:hypothetical protein